jgi:hypothetical protein
MSPQAQPTVGLVASSAGGVEEIRERLVEPMLSYGWRVAVTLTPTAATWLEALGELGKIEDVTGYPVRHAPRLPSEASPHPEVGCYVVAPASANTLAKLALGIADNQALTQLCEAIGGRSVPVVIFPRINAAHAGQPAWNGHIAALQSAGVRLVYGDDVWPLHRPRSAPGRVLPWSAILDVTRAALGDQH